MSYTNEGEIEKYLGVDISGISTFISGIISSIEKVIDNYVGKAFEAASADRYFDGNGSDRLIIDSFIGNPTVIILEVDGTTAYSLTEGQDEDYIVYPLNETEKNELVLVPTSQVGSWLSGKRRIKVTADFGASTSVPDDVKLVATMLASRVIEKSLKGGNLKSVKLGDYQANFKEIKDEADILGVFRMLDKYRDPEI